METRFEGPRTADLRWVVVPATLGSAVIHAAVMGPHFEESPVEGVAFASMVVALGLSAIEAAVRPGRRQLGAVAAVHAVILGLWAWTRTIGLPGQGVEGVAFTDAAAVLLGAAGLGGALAGLSRLVDHRSRSSRRSIAVAGVTVAAVAALTVPAVAEAGDHVHATSAAHGGDEAGHAAAATGADAAHDHSADITPTDTADASRLAALQASSISGIFSTVDHAHHEGGTGNARFHDASSEPCVPTAEQVKAADDIIAAVTFAIERYRDPEVAVADGYRPLGFEPNGIHHYLHAGYRTDDAHLDPTRPEALLYGRTPDGGLIPVGVMFMMDRPGQAGERIGGCLTPWHAHGYPFAPRGQESAEMMHVWTIPVPGGPFAEHIEGEYARLYLGKDAIDADQALNQRTPAEPGTTTTSRTDPMLTIQQRLNAINVHREVLCSPGVRPGLERRWTTPGLIDRLCDPTMNGLLPGAEAVPLAELAAAFD
jgi:hypothetical protein